MEGELLSWNAIAMQSREFLARVSLAYVYGCEDSFSVLFKCEDGQVFQSEAGPLVEIPELRNVNIDSVSAGEDFVLLLTSEGELYSRGKNTYGQLANGTLEPDLKFTRVTDNFPPVRFTKLRAGRHHAVALSSSNELYAWGCDDVQDLAYLDASSNIRVIDFCVKDVDVGDQFTAVLLMDGTVYVKGTMNSGLKFQRLSKVEMPESVRSIACGIRCILLLSERGFVYKIESYTVNCFELPLQPSKIEGLNAEVIHAAHLGTFFSCRNTEGKLLVWGICKESRAQEAKFTAIPTQVLCDQCRIPCASASAVQGNHGPSGFSIMKDPVTKSNASKLPGVAKCSSREKKIKVNQVKLWKQLEKLQIGVRSAATELHNELETVRKSTEDELEKEKQNMEDKLKQEREQMEVILQNERKKIDETLQHERNKMQSALQQERKKINDIFQKEKAKMQKELAALKASLNQREYLKGKESKAGQEIGKTGKATKGKPSLVVKKTPTNIRKAQKTEGSGSKKVVNGKRKATVKAEGSVKRRVVIK